MFSRIICKLSNLTVEPLGLGSSVVWKKSLEEIPSSQDSQQGILQCRALDVFVFLPSHSLVVPLFAFKVIL